MIDGNSEAILIFLLMVFFLTEASTKYSILSIGEKSGIQAAVKALVLGLAFVGILIFRKKEIIYLFILSAIFGIGQLTISNPFEWSVFIYFLKYLFPIVVFGFFTVQTATPKLKLLNFFEFILIFNSVLVLVGLIFEIRYFQTYTGGRFGYNGLMVTSATSTYFYITGMCYFLARHQKNVIKNWKFWFVVLSGLVVGTKSIALALMAIGLFYIIKYVYSKIFKWSLLSIIIVASMGFAYYLFFINPIFQSIRVNNGLLTSFLSLRDQLFMEKTLPYIQENWGFWNFLFGGVSDFELRPQMEIVDIIFFWGIVGSCCYGYFYFKSFFQFKIYDVFIFFVLILLLIISFLAGNFFYNASVAIYLVILRESLLLYQSQGELKE